jgi:hypothetical protein
VAQRIKTIPVPTRRNFGGLGRDAIGEGSSPDGLQHKLSRSGQTLQQESVEAEITAIVNRSAGRKVQVLFGDQAILIDPVQIIEVMRLAE